MNASPLISVCVPTYNGSPYLRQCLDSVIGQTFREIEILVVDDGSTDDTLKIVREYAARDPRFSVVVNDQNLGLVGNWNRCMELARGEWIKFVFQDDLLAPKCVEKMLNAAAASNSSFVVCGRKLLFEPSIDHVTRKIYESNSMFAGIFPDGGVVSQKAFTAAILGGLCMNFVGEPTSVCFRKELFLHYGTFNPTLIQLVDLEYWTRIGSHTGVHFLTENLVSFRVHAASTSEANRGGAVYYSEMDHVNILYDYVFNPRYGRLRKAAYELGSSMSLFNALVAKARGIRWLAIRSANDPAIDDPAQFRHWQAFAAKRQRLENILSGKIRRNLCKLGYILRIVASPTKH